MPGASPYLLHGASEMWRCTARYGDARDARDVNNVSDDGDAMQSNLMFKKNIRLSW